MSYFPEDIPFMLEEERKANGIKTAKEIETLKMQLSKKDATFDSVRRQQVIDRIEWWFKILKQNSDILIDAIKTLPPTHLESHWIPCSERLPDIGDIYIVLIDEKRLRPNESRVACAYWLDDKWQYGVLESYEHKMPKLVIVPLEELTVVAWMPLPEPYEGDDHAD